MRKKLIKFVLILCIVGLAAVGLILWNINPIVESFRPKLAALISDTIKQPTEIGAISLRLFPTQSVELKNITLAGGSAGATSIQRALNDVNLCALFMKRLERGRFVWPQATTGTAVLSAAQLSMLLEGIDWRRPVKTWQPEVAA